MRLLVIAFMVLAACLTAPSGAYAGDQPFSNPAKTIEAEQCREFTIRLESNRTTGFGWDIAEPLDEKLVEFVSCEYVAADTALVGSPGKEIWTFRAVGAGKTTIAFKYVRPWEKDLPPANKTAFAIVVKEGGSARTPNQEDRCSDQR